MTSIDNMRKKTKQSALLLCLVGVFVITAVLLWVNTSVGIGILPDSIIYISAARNLLKGIYLFGISPQGTLTPLSHYPPFYSLLLALSGLILNQDPLQAAKWLNIGIIIANIIICSFLIYNSSFAQIFIEIPNTAVSQILKVVLVSDNCIMSCFYRLMSAILHNLPLPTSMPAFLDLLNAFIRPIGTIHP